jgi:hypothetical protein
VLWPFAIALGTVAGALSLVTGALGAIPTILRTLSLALIGSPIGWILAGIAGAGLLIWKFWAPLKEFFKGFFSGFSKELSNGAAKIKSIMPDEQRQRWIRYAQAVNKATVSVKKFFGVQAEGGKGSADTGVYAGMLAGGWATKLLDLAARLPIKAEAAGYRWGEVGTKWMSDLLSGINTGWPQLVAGIDSRVRELAQKFSNLAHNMYSAGVQIISGLWEGMRAKWDAMLNWVGEKATALANKVQSVLGIKSPSRVFAEIGGNILAGLQVGMGRRYGRVIADMRRIAMGIAAVPIALAPITASAIPAAQSAQNQWGFRYLGAQKMPTAAPPIMPTHVGDRASRGRPGGRGAPRFEIRITNNIAVPHGSDERKLVDLIDNRMRDVSGRLVRRLSAFYDDPDDV